jgi:hypothetical protein
LSDVSASELAAVASGLEAAAAVRGAMLWFNEVKGHGFILTEDGERLYVDRAGFVGEAAPVGRCARLVVSLTVSDRDGERKAIDVSLVPEEQHGRARSHRGAVRRMTP